jgi:hypothetical protein
MLCRMRLRLVSLCLAGAAVGAGTIAWAQREPVLHERVTPPKGGGTQPKVFDSQARNGGKDPAQVQDPTTNPPAIRQGGKLIVEPPKSPEQKAGEPVIGPTSPDRQTSAEPDYRTNADGTLHYSEVFNPSVVPFKRMSALDDVARDYTLSVHDRGTHDLPVGGDLDPERDLFWGSMLIELQPGEDTPIPSVAPDMRFLSYEVAPLAQLTFSRDGADNYFVRADDPRAKGQFRLVFLVDAPARYFAPKVPTGYTLAEVAAMGRAHKLPAPVARTAAEVLDQLGISQSMPLDQAVDALVHYFRGFQAGPNPESSGDIYWDLFTSKTGVCRHRSFAFMVTANAAGIPTRYVTNEAHAFVEIWLPGQEWARVDLGGAALELEVANAEDKEMYRPRDGDPFPKPNPYTEGRTNYSRLGGANVEGLTPQQIEDANTPLDPSAEPIDRDPNGTDPVNLGPGRSLPRPTTRSDVAAGKQAVLISVIGADTTAFRGESMRVTGTMAAGGSASRAAGLRVEIWLTPAGENGEGARLVGETIVGSDGKWSVTVDLPADLLVGAHEVYAHTPGDASRAAAISE